ncbi:hypothetical protein AB1L30_06395 [Bremerella sp. JC817]|uniref:hypothetical protein n=1 Tax=Bremerella sp. JC817 TaxID=3231756 RepID=UPI00345B2EB0
MKDFCRGNFKTLNRLCISMVSGCIGILAGCAPNTAVEGYLQPVNCLTTIECDRFFYVDDFQGTILAIEDKGLPSEDRRQTIANSDHVYNILIQSDDHCFFLVTSFHSGIHAKGDIEPLVGRKASFPHELWIRKDTAFTD